jgi:hypothetical protein
MKIWRRVTDGMSMCLPIVAIEDESDAVRFAPDAIASVSVGVNVELLKGHDANGASAARRDGGAPARIV